MVFYAQDVTFLSSSNLVNITLAAVPYGIISIGVVLVLLLGEIHLSVGSVSGLAASIAAVLIVNQGQPLLVGLVAGIATGTVIGLLYGLLFTKVGVPSFVITLAGLLSFAGLQLVVLGSNGTINLDRESGLATFAREDFLGHTASYILVVIIAALYAGVQLVGIRRRSQAGLSTPPVWLVGMKSALLLAGLGFLTYYLNIDKGWGYAFLLFVALVVVMDLALRKTRWGRHLFAVGGNVEAARRSGIRANLVYVSAFCLTGTFAALGGLMFMAKLTSVSHRAAAATSTSPPSRQPSSAEPASSVAEVPRTLLCSARWCWCRSLAGSTGSVSTPLFATS